MPGERLPEPERREAILEAAYRVACRATLGGLSVRAVAEEAEVSKGLVFFHFSDKDSLLLALLDWILEQNPRVEVSEELAATIEGMAPKRRLVEVVARQVELLEERHDRVELFLDFWVMATGVPEVRRRIHAAFDRYRKEFEPYTRAVVDATPEFHGGDSAGLAAVVVSFIQGCALQLAADPGRFDVDRYMAAVRGLVLGD